MTVYLLMLTVILNHLVQLAVLNKIVHFELNYSMSNLLISYESS